MLWLLLYCSHLGARGEIGACWMSHNSCLWPRRKPKAQVTARKRPTLIHLFSNHQLNLFQAGADPRCISRAKTPNEGGVGARAHKRSPHHQPEAAPVDQKSLLFCWLLPHQQEEVSCGFHNQKLGLGQRDVFWLPWGLGHVSHWDACLAKSSNCSSWDCCFLSSYCITKSGIKPSLSLLVIELLHHSLRLMKSLSSCQISVLPSTWIILLMLLAMSESFRMLISAVLFPTYLFLSFSLLSYLLFLRLWQDEYYFLNSLIAFPGLGLPAIYSMRSFPGLLIFPSDCFLLVPCFLCSAFFFFLCLFFLLSFNFLL